MRCMKISAEAIKRWAHEVGFSACGMSPAGPVEAWAIEGLDAWLEQGCEAGMAYMANHRDLRYDLRGLLEGARTVISVALNYYPPCRRDPHEPYIAYYAYGKDYHDVVKARLRQLWERIRAALPVDVEAEARLFTDSAPLLERYWAGRSGIGWIGKNTTLIIPRAGSFFFLGEIVMTLEADRYDTPMRSHCGTCERCLHACPTGALCRAYCLDARRCISYLTIEHRGEIPAKLASKVQGYLFGCDACQSCCPYNRRAPQHRNPAFDTLFDPAELDAEAWRALDERQFTDCFGTTPLTRSGLERIRGNIRDKR